MRHSLSTKLKAKGADPTKVINRAIELAKDGDTILFPKMRIPITGTLIQNKRVHWEAGEETIIKGMVPSTLAHFKMVSGKFVVDRLIFEGSYGIGMKQDTPQHDGVIINTLVHFRGVQVRNVWGSGIVVDAELVTRGTSASHSRFDDLLIQQVRDHGMYFYGSDANMCGVYHCDVRDVHGVGFFDNSGLGNQFFSCETHVCHGGSYRAEARGGCAGFYGCYAETGQPPVYLDGAATWHGGLPDMGIILASPWARVFSYSTVNIIKQF